ncbi:hypothetical protein BH10BDE1_BH10BDE1_03430 [soil metagenome]
MNSQVDNNKHLQHEGKMSLKERMEESLAYGEEFRAGHAGADQREAVKPLHEKPEEEKELSAKDASESDELEADSFAENL